LTARSIKAFDRPRPGSGCAADTMKMVSKYDECMSRRVRLSATVDADLLSAGREAVAEGRAESLSAWVNDALRLQAEHGRRMRALDEFLAAYEAEHGTITEEEMRAAARRSRARAVVVRNAPADGPRPRRKRGVA
jgi:hypothetical protein